MTTLDGAVDLARDRELVERCQDGDKGAFAELYVRYERRLHRFCLRRLHTSNDADEATQEAFTRAWRALGRFAGERRFYPWLTVIAGNVCTDMLRRRSRLVPMGELPGRDVDVGAPEVDEQLLRQADLALASEALELLSDRHRRVLRLREGTEWSAQRIADHEGVAAPAVDTLLWRARQAFKREFVALSDNGGLAAVVGVWIVGLRRGIGRAFSRLSTTVSALGSVPRGAGTIAATAAFTGAAVVGTTFAVVATSNHDPSGTSVAATTPRAPSGDPAAAPVPDDSTRGSGSPAAHAPVPSVPSSGAAMGAPLSNGAGEAHGNTASSAFTTLGTSSALGGVSTGSTGTGTGGGTGGIVLGGASGDSGGFSIPSGSLIVGLGGPGASGGGAGGSILTAAASTLTSTGSVLGTAVEGAKGEAFSNEAGATAPAEGASTPSSGPGTGG